MKTYIVRLKSGYIHIQGIIYEQKMCSLKRRKNRKKSFIILQWVVGTRYQLHQPSHHRNHTVEKNSVKEIEKKRKRKKKKVIAINQVFFIVI